MDKLVDRIVSEVLSQTGTEPPAQLNRPNYQRKARPCSTVGTATAAVPPPFPQAGGPQGKPAPADAGHVPPPFPLETKGCKHACEDCCCDLEPGQTLPDLAANPEQALRWIRLQNGGLEE